MSGSEKKTTAMDMTQGSITRLLISFAVPLLFGNLFQLFYNTVDVLVVGNFVGKEALAAVGSTTPIINILVSFFNGFSVGAGVIVSRYYGAKRQDMLHRSIQTTMACTFVCCVLFTIIGVGAVPWMLRLMSTPDDVMEAASTYLRIYFAGIAGLLIYNMGSGILRAVGDTRRPLLFLCCTSLMNVVLDLVFVLVFHHGVDGVAYATIISQFVSAIMVLVLLSRTTDVYRMEWKELRIDRGILGQIMGIALPTAVQSTITCFSNVIVQAYINSFGSGCMAGWSCYSKIDQYLFIPMQSMSQATTTFVSQNVGARNVERARKGTRTSLIMTCLITFTTSMTIWLFAEQMTGLFSQDPEVLEFGVLFIHMNILFLNCGSFNQVLAGALRGIGDAKAPMFIMLASFVVFRQLYLFVGTHIHNTIHVVGFGYPMGWMLCAILMISYYRFSPWEKRLRDQATAG